MNITTVNQAIDEHTRLLTSISPISNSEKMMRLAMLVSSIITTAAPPRDGKAQIPLVDMGTLASVVNDINGALGQGTMEKELGGFIAHELEAMREAQTIFCTEDIFDEISEAQQTMLDDIILAQDVFTPSGFIVFEKPYKFYNVAQTNKEVWQKEEWNVSSIMFRTGENRSGEHGISVYMYGHWRSVEFYEMDRKPIESDVYDARFVFDEKTGNTFITYKGKDITSEIQEEVTLASKHSDTYRDKATGTPCFVDGTFFSFGETKTTYDKEVVDIKKFLLAFFRLTYEYLEVSHGRVDKPFHKRAKRAGRTTPEDGYITVMTLRRKLYGGEEVLERRNGPAYAFRVRGHWRKAYMASRKLPVGDPAAYKHIYIKDYIKGRGIVVKSKRVVKVGD